MSPELFKFKHSPHQAATNSTLAPRRPCSPPTKLGSSHSVIILLVSTSAANRPPSRVNMPQPSAANNFAASLLEQLPAELLMTIFRLLSPGDLLRVEATLPRWKQIVRRHVWPLERLRTFTRNQSPDFIRRFIAQRGYHLHELELDGYMPLEPFLPLFPRLRRISICNLREAEKDSVLAKLKERFGW